MRAVSAGGAEHQSIDGQGARSPAMKLLFSTVLGAVALLGAHEARAQAGDTTAKIERLFREGVDLFEMGKYPQARTKLRQVLQLDPNAAEAWKLIKVAGDAIIIEMLTVPEMAGREARVIYELYRLHAKRLKRKPELIQRLVKTAIDPLQHPRKRWDATNRLTEVGQFVIPYVVDALGDKRNDDARAYARRTATKMGRSATLPVIELLKFRAKGLVDAERAVLVRENAAIILGDLNDKRALAPLKRVAEDEEESAVVRKYALMSLQKIAGLDVDELKSAQDYYWLQADRYVRELPGVAAEAMDADGVIWRLEDGKLVDRQIPRFAWNELMAEQMCFECMDIGADYEVIYSIFAEVIASQIAEVDELLDVALGRPVGRPFTEEELTDVRARRTKLLVEPLSLDSQGPIYISAPALKVPRVPSHRSLLLSSIGPVYVYRAIGKCLTDAEQDGRELPKLAATILCDIAYALDPDGRFLPRPGESGSGRKGRGKAGRKGAVGAGEGASLVKALRFPDARVNYAAAIALARMNPAEPFDGADEVVNALALAINASGPLQVLIVEEDPSVRNEMAGKLREFDMGVSAVETARDGFTKAVDFPPCDIVLVSPNLKKEESADWLLEKMKADPRTRGVAAAMMVSYSTRESHKATYKRHENVKGYVPIEDTGKELRDLINKVAGARATPIMSKKRSEEISVIAAETLCQVNPDLARISGMLVDQAAEACIASLKNRSDQVRRPCIDALGRFKVAKAHDKLLEILRDPMQSLDIRVAAARAVSLITPEADFGRLLEAASDGKREYVIRYLTAEGIGHGSPRPEKLKEVLERLRLPLGGKRVLKSGEAAP